MSSDKSVTVYECDECHALATAAHGHWQRRGEDFCRGTWVGRTYVAVDALLETQVLNAMAREFLAFSSPIGAMQRAIDVATTGGVDG